MTDFAMAKDPRFRSIGKLIKAGEIKGIHVIFTMIPITVVRNDSGIHFNTLRRRISNPSTFKIAELIILAEIFETSTMELIEMVLNELKDEPLASKKQLPPDKDHRYKAVGILISSGEIKSLKNVFDLIAKKVVLDDSGIIHATLYRKIYKPGGFILSELIILAALFEVPVRDFVTLVLNDINRAKATRR